MRPSIISCTMLVILWTAAPAWAFVATSSTIDLNAYMGDASGIFSNSTIDLNFFVSEGQPTGVFSATTGSSSIDLNLGTIFEKYPYCGDGVCQASESCSICSADCGSCPAPPSGGTTTTTATTSGDTGGGGGGGGPTPSKALKPRLDIFGLPREISVAQGEFESFTFTVKNTGEVKLGAIAVSVEGIPKEWFTLQKEASALDVNREMVLVAKIAVPADARVKAYPIFIRVTSDTAKNGAELTLRVSERQVSGGGAVFRDVRVSNAIVGQDGVITTVIFNPSSEEATFIATLEAPQGWVVEEKEIEVTLKPGEEKEVSFHFRAPEKSGVEQVSIVTRNKAAGKAWETVRKSFFVIINKPQELGLGQAAVVVTTTGDVILSAVFFTLLTGIVIAFFATTKKMFLLGRR